MNLTQVATECMHLIKNNPWKSHIYECSPEYCIHICDSLIKEEMKQDKINQWIGWLQACMCLNGIVTVDELKKMNNIKYQEK